MFLTQWLFDKLGYAPKITIQTELSAWPFPMEELPVKNKAVARKQAAKKSARKTVRKKA